MTIEQAQNLLVGKGQEGLLKYWSELTEKERNILLSAVENMDWGFEKVWRNPQDLSGAGTEIKPIRGLTLAEIETRKEEYKKIGIEALQKGKVAAVLLAGGQGSRLGSDAPKGAYDIGITKHLYIFEQQVKNILEDVKEAGVYPPLYIMTSEKNHDATKAFWEEHGFFSYPKNEVVFFKQGMSPAVDFNGKIYLENKYTPALSPNGNGGWFGSMCKAGLDKDMEKRGVEWLNIYAVDNVLQRILDPVFIGATIESGVNCGAKAVRKTDPYEKVGALCLQDGKPAIIEYYELTDEMANERDEDGELSYSFGVIMNYLFRVEKLKEIAGEKMPVHVVKKKIEYLDENGETKKPQTENGYKFETLAVDLIKLMDSVLPFEVEREKEFAPIKNKTGVDSVESARILLQKNGVKL